MTAETNASGLYLFTIPPGEYSVRAESRDHGDAAVKSIKVEGTSRIDLTLVQVPFSDEPQFTVAGVADNTYRGGHGPDTILRSSEDLSRATATLSGSRDTPALQKERAGHSLDAVRELQQSAERDPNENNLFDWGTELLSHRAPQPACEVFAKGVRLFPQATRMLLGLASAHYAAGHYDQAAQYFFQASDLDPDNPKPYLFLAQVEAREITGSAGYRTRLARFAKLSPGNVLANYYYAVTLSKQGQTAEAITFFKKALLLDPHLAPAYLQLGMIHAAEQSYSAAASAYRQAIAEDPELEEAHFRLSEVYRVTGDRVRAQQESAAYRRLNKDSSDKLEQERRQIQQFVVALKSQ